MSFAELLTENPFLLLSIVSGAAAAAVLLGGLLKYRLRNASNPDKAASSREGNKWRQSVFDRITLLNRNLIQCPQCFMINFSNVRSCSRCGMQFTAHSETLREHMDRVQAQYLVRDGPTRVVGLSITPDAKTRIGVIVGIKNLEHFAGNQQCPE
jgi:hypothetical protein